MDDILNVPSWLDVGGLNTQLDGGVPAELGSSISVAAATSKASEQGLMSPPTPESYRSSSRMRGFQDGQVEGSVDFRSDDSLLAAQIQHQLSASTFPMERGLSLLQSMQGNPGDTTNSMPSTPLRFSLPTSSLGLTLNSRPWHQPYVGDMQPLLTGTFSNSNDGADHLYATRYQGGFSVNMDGTQGLFNAYAGPRPSVPGLQHQANSPRASQVSPRVRARRGQATDPHSIAERKRREKIAKMTRDLQLLLPNANKTDKAIMLDEVIEYVKFLKLQTKVFGSSPSLLHSEYNSSSMASHDTSESLVNIERQVIQLMDENMDAALQFLQSNGFVLMPISMAAAIYCVHQP